MTDSLHDRIDAVVESHHEELVELRRDLHAHPELAWQEQRTTATLAKRLLDAGARVRELPRSGLVADIGPEATAERPVVALRADVDALPLHDRGGQAFDSRTPGIAHACGHDLHAAAVLGAGIALSDLADADLLERGVRLVLQPAEETMPGGALHAIEAGALEHVSQMYAVHCDPALDVGAVGLREGPLTGAADAMTVELHGDGGHTSRPHLTQDLTFALAKVVTELPTALTRRLDPRSGVSVVWGAVHAGEAMNVVPSQGVARGSLRTLDVDAWHSAEGLVRELVEQIVVPYGVRAVVHYTRGVPPVDNHPVSVHRLREAADEVVGESGVVQSVQSLGGEDFGWYLHHVPGAMARLGTRTPGGFTYDLHRGDLVVDERALGIAARLLARVALTAGA